MIQRKKKSRVYEQTNNQSNEQQIWKVEELTPRDCLQVGPN